MGNVPADPFRAYQIDKSLYAHIRPEGEWKKEVNRKDIVPVDYPSGMSMRPTGKRTIPTHREPERRPERPEPKAPPTPLGRELKWRAREVAHRFKVPIPALDLMEHRSYRHSYQQVGISGATHEPKGKGSIHIGVKGSEKGRTKSVMLGAFYHELGHHVDAFLGYKKTGKMNKQFVRDALAGQFSGATGRRAKIGMERRAWNYASPYMKGQHQPLKKWAKNFALGTYQGRVKSVTEL
jgi:hypothetical protein